MKFAMACYGTRGDVEPSVAVGRELLRRGHGVCMAVPPDLVGFAEAAGLATVAYGPELQAFLHEDFVRNLWTQLFRNPIRSLRELWEPIARYWGETSATLTSLADGADLLSTGLNFEQAAANVAEYYDIPLIALHHFPMRANGQLVPILPSPLVRSAGTLTEWLFWRSTHKVEDTQRRELGLPKATGPSPRRIAERKSLEIQAYDEFCFPGLAAEWAKWDGRRPFIGTLTMELTTDADDEVASWSAAGTPPICFATGSIPVESPADTVEMISAACAQLGERALVCFGGTDFSHVPHFDHVKVVGPVNYAATFPACRAVVHHGGSGTTAASLRAGIPTLILWSSADQPYWGNQLKRLKVGTARRFSTTTHESLVADLRRILAPQYAIRARELATRMTTPAKSVAKAADLFEDAVRRKRVE
jgi:UDP:flavonoid glycosyltransferase YjiC (YdhE family)